VRQNSFYVQLGHDKEVLVALLSSGTPDLGGHTHTKIVDGDKRETELNSKQVHK
jgi:hypothetical protein